MSGRNRAGSVSSCSRNTPVGGDLRRSACRSAEQETAIATGQEAPCRGSRTTRTSWQKYLPPNCAPMPKLAGQLQHLRLQLEVPEAVRGRRARRGQRVEVLRRGVLRGLEGVLRGGAADDDRPGGTAGRRRCRARAASRPGSAASRRGSAPPWSPGRGTTCSPLPPPLAMNRNLYAGSSRAGVGVDLDLGGQVGAGVPLVPHGQRRQLRVAQVEPGVGVVHAAADRLRVVAAGERPARPSCPSRSRCRCPGTSAARRRRRCSRSCSRSSATNRSFADAVRVVDDAAQLGQVGRPQVVGDVVHRLVGEPGQGRRARPAGTAAPPASKVVDALVGDAAGTRCRRRPAAAGRSRRTRSRSPGYAGAEPCTAATSVPVRRAPDWRVRSRS